MSVRINNKLPKYSALTELALEAALREGARDILIKAKNRAPKDAGGLRRETDITTPRKLAKRVSFWVEYARFQEFGGDSKRTVRNYTTPGTGKRYLRTAGDEISAKFQKIVTKHTNRVRV